MRISSYGASTQGGLVGPHGKALNQGSTVKAFCAKALPATHWCCCALTNTPYLLYIRFASIHFLLYYSQEEPEIRGQAKMSHARSSTGGRHVQFAACPSQQLIGRPAEFVKRTNWNARLRSNEVYLYLMYNWNLKSANTYKFKHKLCVCIFPGSPLTITSS